MKPLISALIFCATSSVFACQSSVIIPQVAVNFYENQLGVYDIDLQPTLTAIANHDADEEGYQSPYYEKTWTGACPPGLSGEAGSCREYTVYPNNQNFKPAGIMQRIKQYNNGQKNRGEVRIITNADETQYVYTTNHEQTFSEPCSLKLT